MCVKNILWFLCTLIIQVFVNEVYSARILGVFPIPASSHQIVFKTYMQELAKRGHELVIITPEPIGNKSVGNITEIDTSPVFNKYMDSITLLSKFKKRGVIMDIEAVLQRDVYKFFLEMVVDGFHQPAVENFIRDRTQKFDLIVLEAFFDYQLFFSEIFAAPVITFASFMGFPEHYEMFGAIGRHPLYFPHMHRMYSENLGYWDMLKELCNEYKLYKLMLQLEQNQDMLLKKNFGENAPTIRQLRDNVDMLFLSVHPMLVNNRPVPPNIVFVHAPHIQPSKDLPQDIKSFLDNSKTGAVYVSFGSNVNHSMMDKEFADVFLNAFKALPYDILWKYDGEDLIDAKNIKVQKWFPQQAVLRHPNVKVFVTQCGIQSTSEAIDAAVPLVGVPMAAEQFYNAQKYVDFKIGVKMDTLTLTADDLIRGVKTVFENKSYKENIERLRGIFRDQPESSMERAIWWTEYVLRHKGAKHLRSPIANVSWTEYYMLNYALPILVALVLIVHLVLFSLYAIVKQIWKLLKSNKIVNKQANKLKKR